MVDVASYTLRRIWFPIFLIVLIPVIITGLLIYHGILPRDEFFRPVMEKASLIILGIACVLAMIRYLIDRIAIFIWLFFLAVTLLCREFHFRGSGSGVYVALAILFYVGWCHYDKLAGYFANRTFVTMFFLVFFLYALSTSLDRSAWRFLPHRRIWSSPLEETVETVGHVVFILAILLSRFSENTLITRIAKSNEPNADIGS